MYFLPHKAFRCGLKSKSHFISSYTQLIPLLKTANVYEKLGWAQKSWVKFHCLPEASEPQYVISQDGHGKELA